MIDSTSALSLSPPSSMPYPPAHPSRYLAPSSSSSHPSLQRRNSSRSSTQSFVDDAEDEDESSALERGRHTGTGSSTGMSHDPPTRGVSLLEGLGASGSLRSKLTELQRLAKGYERTAKRWLEANAGLCLIAMAQMFFASMNASVKYLNTIGGSLPTLELVLIRMIFTLAGCVGWLVYTGDENPLLGPREVRGLLAWRGFIGFFGLTGMYQSLRHLSLSDSTTLSFLAPTATALLGYAVLGEPFERKESVAGFISLFGVILIARPSALFGTASSDDSTGTLSPDYSLSRVQTSKMEEPAEVAEAGQRLAAVGFALMGVCGSAGAYIAIRAIGKRAKPFHSITYFSFWCVVVSTLGMIVLKVPIELPKGAVGWFSILVIGVFGLAAQVLLTMGLQREKAGRASLAMYTQLLFAGFIERVFFHTVPPLLSLFGTFIILAAALWVAFSKRETPPSAGSRGQGINTTSGDYLPLTQMPEEIPENDHAVPPPRTLASQGINGNAANANAMVVKSGAAALGRGVPHRKASSVSMRTEDTVSLVDEGKGENRT